MDVKSTRIEKIAYSYWTLFLAIVTTGPFAIPLLLKNPNISKTWKIIGTVGILALTWGLVWFSAYFLQKLNDEMMQRLQIHQQ